LGSEYIPVALEIFDLHYSLGHEKPFRNCTDAHCLFARSKVTEYALDQLHEGRQNTTIPDRKPWTVKLRPGGADWDVTEPEALCPVGNHRIADHLQGGRYEGIPLSHDERETP
jgi:hypothetical protein